MITITIPVVAVPKQSTCKGKHGFFMPKKAREYLDRVMPYVLQQAPDEPIKCPLFCTYRFYFPIPKSAKIKTMPDLIKDGDSCQGKKDIDNLMKAINDIMEKAEVFLNDSQIVSVLAWKYYSNEPKTIIELYDARGVDVMLTYDPLKDLSLDGIF